MIKLEFTEADPQILNYERYHHPHPRAQRKMESTLVEKSWGGTWRTPSADGDQ